MVASLTIMAAQTKIDRLSSSFVTRLKRLCCPYTEDINEGFILTILMSPGEGRIKILHWLLCRVDVSVYETLEPAVGVSLTHVDSRIQKLLQVSSALGLCHEQDVDLIRGVTGGKPQVMFIDHIINLATVTDEAGQYQSLDHSDPHFVTSKMNLDDQIERDGVYLDTLVRDHSVSALLKPHTSLLPPDIMKHVEDKWRAQGHNMDKPPQPDTKALNQMLEDMTVDVAKKSMVLKQLKDGYEFDKPGTEDVSQDNTRTSLRLALSQTCHLLTSFTYTFNNEIRPWCTHTAPALTDLGPSLDRVFSVLQNLNKILANIQQIKSTVDRLADVMSIQSTEASAKNARQTCEEFVNILEESMARQNHSLSTSHISTSKIYV